MIRKYFMTGLVILLPAALTLAIVIFIVSLLTDPFVGSFKALMERYHLLEHGFLFLGAEQLQKIISQIAILGLLFCITVGLGFFARWFLFHYLLRAWDGLLHRIPFIRSVYKGSKEVITTIFSSDTNAFKQVVLVPFPSPNSRAIGFVTGARSEEEYISVFVPTTPNPTSGFLMMFKPGELVFCEMKVEDAFKYIISCGVTQIPLR